MPKTKDGGGGKTRPPQSKYPPKPEIPFRIGDGDANYLRKLYADDYTDKQGRRGYKELLDEAYSEYKEKLDAGFAKEIGLPDTLREMLEMETGNIEGDATPGTFPARAYIGIIGKANLIWEDTLRAKAVINLFDGNKPGQMPRRMIQDEISSIFDDYDMEPTIRDELALPFVVATFENEQDPATTFEESISKIEERAKAFFHPSDFIYQFALSTNGADKDKAYKATLKTGKGVIADVFVSIADKIEQETGEDAAQILDKKKRTQEQYRLLVKAVRKVITARTETLYKSKFMQAVWTMQTTDTSEKAQKLSSATHSAAIKYACYYFFAKHPEIDFREQDTLKDEYAQEVKDIYTRLTDSIADQLRAASQKKKTLSAWDAFMNFIKAENPEGKGIEQAVKAVAHEIKETQFQLDKVNSNIWSDIQYASPTSDVMQLAFGFNFADEKDNLPAINTASKKDRDKGKDALILWGLRFDDLPDDIKISKQLTPYDRLCYDAIGALYRDALKKGEGPAVTFTPTQICKAMGYTSNPPKKELEKLINSLRKMRAAIIYIDTTNEKEVNKSYPLFKYEGALLQWDKVEVIVRGKKSATGIRILSFPPLIGFAIGRKQYTSFPLSVYQFPLSKSDSHIRIAQYLAEQICHMKNNPGFSQYLTYEKIFARCMAKTWRQKDDAKKAIAKLMEYWKNDCGFIGSGSRTEEEGIFIDIGRTTHTRRIKAPGKN